MRARLSAGLTKRSHAVTRIGLGIALGLAWGATAPRRAAAQYGGMPGQPGGGGMPQAPMGQEPKEEGPAEAAPEEEGRPSDLEPLAGYAEQNRKQPKTARPGQARQ